ncbi:MAG: ATP-binding protein [Muricauda sp. TMED12]|nr:MAG: ATP-binding protein [Muricauda sp. TMED12]
MFGSDKLKDKWSPILEHTDLPEIQDKYKKAVTAVVLENQEKALREERGNASYQLNETAANATGSSVDNWDPILISLVRRAMPNLIAYDIAGVQPMTGPTGLIFAMKSKYTSQSGTEALYNEADTDFSGTGTQGGGSSSLVGDINPPGTSGESSADTSGGADTVEDAFGLGGGMTTAAAEALGNTGNAFAEMAFSIDKATVTAKSRALKAEYTMELAQDLKAIHGLDAEGELANILSAEILAEINREVIRTINSRAKLGAQQANTAVNGTFNLSSDADGRWSVEKFKGLILQIERESNVIAKETRRGKGNFIICSSDVASALAAAGMLDYTPALSANLNVDDTGNTFAGVLNGRTKVYIDPYANTDYVNVGYRGTNPYDAGMFYCPYVPLTMVRAVGESDFQPRIGFKTRYGMVANPFVGTAPGNDIGAVRANQYFRIFGVTNILT